MRCAISFTACVEDGLVGLRGLGRAGDLADVLQRGSRHLVTGRRGLEVVERSDVAAHATFRIGRRTRRRLRSPARPGRRRSARAGPARSRRRTPPRPSGWTSCRREREHRDPAGAALPALGDDGQGGTAIGQPGELARVGAGAGVRELRVGHRRRAGRGEVRSVTSKRAAWAPRVMPELSASWPMPISRRAPSGWRYSL